MERDQEQKTAQRSDQSIEQENNLPKGNVNTAGEGTRKDTSSGPKDTAKKVTFIGIALLILFLIAFGIVRILPSIIASLAGAGSGLSSVFSPREELEVTLNPSTIKSGEQFTVNWKHVSPSAAGRYTFTYACGSNFYIEHTYPNNKTEKVICDTPFVLPTRETSLPFKAFLTEENSYADVPLFVNFIQEGTNEPKIAQEVTLTIQNGEGAATATSTPSTNEEPVTTRPTTTSTTTSQNRDYINRWGSGSRATTTTTTRPSTPTTGTTPKPTTPTTPKPTTPTGKADLVAVNPVVGTINPSTNVFTAGAKIVPGSRVGVQFEVVNNGGTASGNWKLSAVLPTSPAETLQSQSQTSLRPGDRMIFTLSFDNLVYKADNSVVVHLDPSNSIAEANENNNTLFISVKQDVGSSTSKPDLSVDILDYDVNGDDASIRFRVTNKGAAFNQNWVFKVNLPYNQTFTSNNQTGMNSNESREFTVNVTELADNTTHNIKIEVDSSDKVSESSESNNEDSITIRN